MNTRRRLLRMALLLPVSLAVLPAAVDDSCHSVAVEDEIEGVIERQVGNELISTDVPSDATVTLVEQSLDIEWLDEAAAVLVRVALPEDLESYSHAEVDLEGSVCRCEKALACAPEDTNASCSALTGVLTIAHTGRVCADGDCQLTFELGIAGTSEADDAVTIDLVRTAETEESDCSSGCGRTGMFGLQ